MMLVYCKSESDSTTYDFFMKYIPENISCTLEALAYISLFESQIAYRCGDFNWEDKKLQNFLGSNHIQTMILHTIFLNIYEMHYCMGL